MIPVMSPHLAVSASVCIRTAHVTLCVYLRRDAAQTFFFCPFHFTPHFTRSSAVDGLKVEAEPKPQR